METALSESRHVESDADCYRFNGYGHLEAVSNESLLEDARDNIDDIIDWLEGASRYDLEGVSSDVELFMTAEDPIEIINAVDCSVRSSGDTIEVDLSRGDKKVTLSFSKLNDIDVDKIDLANAAYATAEGYYRYADGASTEEVQTAFFKENGRRLSDARADDLTEAYEKLFHGFENVADIPYSGPVVDPIAFQPTFIDSAGRDRSNDVDLGSLALLLSGSDVISTQSVPELLEIMPDRFGIEPEERAANDDRARVEECLRTGVPDIQVEIDSTNDDNFIEGTVTVEGESCYFYRPNSTRSTEDYDSVVFEPFRPDGFEGDIEEIELPDAIDQNRELAELVVSVATEPYMNPDKAVGREQSIDSLCDEKTEVSESMRYGMEGVGLPMLDAAEHLMNY